MAYLQMRDIRASYNGIEVLHGVDLDAAVGEVHALVGENGAGKSTLMKILAGDLRADTGTVCIGGTMRDFKSPADSQAAGVAMIHQELCYVPRLTVAENLMLGRLPTKPRGFIDWGAVRAIADRVLQAAGASIDPGARMDSLSLGNRQIIEILRAVSRRARLIVMDEPTSSLNADEAESLFRIIDTLRTSGVSVIYISHHLDEIFSTADTVTVLRDGWTVSHSAVSTTTHNQVVHNMVGSEVRRLRIGDTGRVTATTRLAVIDLHASSDVHGVSFEVRAGEVVGLYGLLGGGQEQVARALYGMEPDVSGGITIDGVQVFPRSPRAAIAAGIGFVPADRKLEGIVPRRGVRENMTYPWLRFLTRAGVLRLRHEARLVLRLAETLRIVAEPNRRVESLSGGNQQKVVVSRWFARPVKLLVLIDPTRGVDVRARAEIHGLVHQLGSEGVSVLVASGDVAEVMDVSDRILVMRRGKIVKELSTLTTTANEVVSYAASSDRASRE